MKKAFTLLELLLVIAITAIFVGVSTPFYVNFINQNNVDTAQDRIASTFRKAQSYAMSHKDGSDWQVAFPSNEFVLYRVSDNKDFDRYTLPPSLSMQIVSGSSPVTFSSPLGKPNAELKISLNNGNDIGTIVVSREGAVSEE